MTTTTTSEEEAAEALKLKEALEVARQNFYKGKLSQVCLSKHGEGYVVKEMKEHHHHAPPKSLNTSASNTSDDLVPKINVEDVTCCDVSITNKDGLFVYFQHFCILIDRYFLSKNIKNDVLMRN